MVGMGVLNPVCGVGAMAFASPSLLAPFSGLTLVWVILFSKPMTGDLPNRTQVLAATMIIIGEIIVTLAGDHEGGKKITIDEFNDIYRNTKMVLYLLSFTAFYGLVIYVAKTKEKWEFAHKVSWGIGGGSISGLLFFINDALDLAATSDRFHWQVPVFIFMAIFVGVSGLIFLSHCMKRFDATYSASMFVVSYIISATIMSAIRYNMFDRINGPLQLSLYPLGMAILFFGVYLLMIDKQFKFDQWKWLQFLESILPCCCPKDEAFPAAPLLDSKTSTYKGDDNGNDLKSVELAEKGMMVEEKKE